MSKDLTRWNRAGLGRFRYVDGNAITYLERLRRALEQRLPAWKDLEAAPALGQSSEERWLAQYQGKRRDFAWEIARALARSAHVLTEHLDTYANEGYLGTATQWDNVRRLVEMLDYHPAPPASASTYLVLRAKNKKRGTVEAGFQVKNAPEDGSAPLIFETLDDLALDHDLDALRCKDWNRSQAPFQWSPVAARSKTYQGSFPASEAPEGISKGSRGVLVVELSATKTAGIPITVSSVGRTGLTLTGPALPANARPTLGAVRLFLDPQIIQKPRLHGASAVEFEQVHGLRAGDALTWKEGSVWKAGRVQEVDNKRAILSGGLPPVGAEVYPLLAAKPHQIGGASKLIVPLVKDRQASTIWKSDLSAVPASSVTPRKIPIDEDGTKVDAYDEITVSLSLAHYLAADTPSAGTVRARGLTKLVMDGDPGNLASGQWAILAHKTGAWEARPISAVETSDDSYVLELDTVPTGTVTMAYADFAVELRPDGHDRNLLPAYDTSQSVVAGSVIPLASLPAGLEKGRRLVVQGQSKAALVTVAAVATASSSIVVTPTLPGEGSGKTGDFPRHATTIYGNVTLCGHGESKPAKILGSGDATRSNQTFLLQVENLAFIADATQASGVRAAIEVSVDGRTWQQVATLNDSEPTDHHYTVRMTQDGQVEIGFGDGEHGRRLPTGTNNVRAVYRVGSGSSGNLPALSLTKPVKPHPLVDAVLQPLPASGGGDMESVDSLRDNAPSSLLTLGRAVSLRDFTHLAGRHSSVWQARAFALPTGFARHESVEVVVVPAGGGDLTSALKNDLETYLEAAAVPGVEVQITRFDAIFLDLDVTVQVVTSAFDPDAVVDDVRAALVQALSLRKVALGRPLHRSDIYQVVEAVKGVENSTCTIKDSTVQGASKPRRVARGSDLDIRAIFATERQIIHIDPRQSSITIAYEEFTL